MDERDSLNRMPGSDFNYADMRAAALRSDDTLYMERVSYGWRFSQRDEPISWWYDPDMRREA